MRAAYHASVGKVAEAIAAAGESGPAGIAGSPKAAEPAGSTRIAEIAEVDIAPLLEVGDLLYRGPWVAERLADLQEFLLAHPEDVLPVTRQVIESGRRHDAVATFRAMHRLGELRRWTDLLWERADMLLLPTVPTTYTIEQIKEQPIERNSRARQLHPVRQSPRSRGNHRAGRSDFRRQARERLPDRARVLRFGPR